MQNERFQYSISLRRPNEERIKKDLKSRFLSHRVINGLHKSTQEINGQYDSFLRNYTNWEPEETLVHSRPYMNRSHTTYVKPEYSHMSSPVKASAPRRKSVKRTPSAAQRQVNRAKWGTRKSRISNAMSNDSPVKEVMVSTQDNLKAASRAMESCALELSQLLGSLNNTSLNLRESIGGPKQ